MEIVIRSTVIFFFLWIVTRAVGRRELSQLSAFELLLLVTFGDLVQQGVTQEDMSLTGAVLAVGTMALLTVLLSYLSFRFRRTEPVLEGLPVIIVRDGRPLEDVLRIERLSVAEVDEAAREQGIGDLKEVTIGIIERDGKFSFIKRDGGSSGRPDPGAQEHHV
jgi:uncharacterized membrane protein YcaP (DUF421 family)